VTDIIQKLIVPELDCDLLLSESDPARFSEQFDMQGRPGSVACLNWKDFPDKPEVSFRIGWCRDRLLLKYYVREREILGRYSEDGSPVYTDSCVEFFLSPEGSPHYYNFEFNCLGTALVQVGTERAGREALGSELTEGIQRFASLGREPLDKYHQGLAGEAEPWSLMLVIPAKLLIRDRFDTFKGARFRANFYKCGDDHESPHYLSWNPIATESPDFHRPEFFGELWFS
jgi:hypothetical protein